MRLKDLNYSLVVHEGAGIWKGARRRKGLRGVRRAKPHGVGVLRNRGTALDAVESSAITMEMEAFNGTVRSREKVMRSLKREDSSILDGYQIFHHYVRPHDGLKGKTPAEACGVKVEGRDKWLTLIQNASKNQD